MPMTQLFQLILSDVVYLWLAYHLLCIYPLCIAVDSLCVRNNYTEHNHTMSGAICWMTINIRTKRHLITVTDIIGVHFAAALPIIVGGTTQRVVSWSVGQIIIRVQWAHSSRCRTTRSRRVRTYSIVGETMIRRDGQLLCPVWTVVQLSHNTLSL